MGEGSGTGGTRRTAVGANGRVSWRELSPPLAAGDQSLAFQAQQWGGPGCGGAGRAGCVAAAAANGSFQPRTFSQVGGVERGGKGRAW